MDELLTDLKSVKASISNDEQTNIIDGFIYSKDQNTYEYYQNQIDNIQAPLTNAKFLLAAYNWIYATWRSGHESAGDQHKIEDSSRLPAWRLLQPYGEELYKIWNGYNYYLHDWSLYIRQITPPKQKEQSDLVSDYESEIEILKTSRDSLKDALQEYTGVHHNWDATTHNRMKKIVSNLYKLYQIHGTSMIESKLTYSVILPVTNIKDTTTSSLYIKMALSLDVNNKPFISFSGRSLSVNDYTRDMSYRTTLMLLMDTFTSASQLVNYGAVLLYNSRSELLSNRITSEALFNDRFDNESLFLVVDDMTNSRILQHELYPHWKGKKFTSLYYPETNVKLHNAYVKLNLSFIENYGFNPLTITTSKMPENLFMVPYKYDDTWRIVIMRYITIEKILYRISCSITVNDYISQSIIAKGDSTFYGDVTVKSTSKREIFHIDTLNKTTSNMYPFGIGTSQPTTMLDIQDTSIIDVNYFTSIVSTGLQQLNSYYSGRYVTIMVDDVDTELNIDSMQIIGLSGNNIEITSNTGENNAWIRLDLGNLHHFSKIVFSNEPPKHTVYITNDPYVDEEDNIQRVTILHSTIELIEDIDNEPTYTYNKPNLNELNPVTEQNDDDYVYEYRLDKNTTIAGEIFVSYHGLYSSWTGKTFNQIIIEDVDNSDMITRYIIPTLQTIIDSSALSFIQDGNIYPTTIEFISGVKYSIHKITVGQGQDKPVSILGRGWNIQRYGIHIINNPNITKLFDYIDTIMKYTGYIQHKSNPKVPISITIPSYIKSIASVYPDMTKNIYIYTSLGKNILDTKVYIGVVDADYKVTQTIINSTLSTPLIDGQKTPFIHNIEDLSKRAQHTSFLVAYHKEHSGIEIGDVGITSSRDSTNSYYNIFYKLSAEEIVVFYVNVTNDYIPSSVSLKGDMSIEGELSLSGLTTGSQSKNKYLTIDPENKFVGINTNNRFLNYSSEYTTTSSIYNSLNHVAIKNAHYPNVAFDRVAETKEDEANPDYSHFGSYSASTMIRSSDLWNYDEIQERVGYLNESILVSSNLLLDEESKNESILWDVKKYYGPDISFEVKDKTGLTTELGEIKMVIDHIDASNNIHAGFGVQVIDKTISTTFDSSLKNLMYVNNDKELFVDGVNLGGHLLKADGDKLTWGGKTIISLE